MRGEASGEEDDAVVRITSRQPSPLFPFWCSGVLLAPNLVMTALSCVSVYDNSDLNYSCESDGTLSPGRSGGSISKPLDPERIEVFFGTELSAAPDPPIAVHARGREVFGSGSATVCRDEIALVVLDTPLPSAGLPIRLEKPVVRGERMTLIGYGVNDVDALRARRSGVPVLEVGPDDTSDGPGLAYPRTFTVGDGPCSSDSGGPAISEETGAVAGIFAHNFGQCQEPGTRGWYTKIAPYATLVQRAFEAAGGEPMVEPAPQQAAPASGSGCTVTRASDRCGSVAFLGALVSVLTLRRRGARVRTPRRS
jgi:hypothetical protein